MKVLHVIDSGGFYGAEAMLLALCIEQRKCGIDCELLSMGNMRQPAKEIEERMRMHGIPVHVWRFSLFRSFSLIEKKSRWIEAQGFDLIHSHGYKGNVLFGLLGKKKRNIPLCSTVHGYTASKKFSKLWIYQKLDTWALKQLECCIFVSPVMLNNPSYNGISGDNCRVVVNGISETVGKELRADLEIMKRFVGDDYVVVSIGRMSAEKNFRELIEAFHKLKSTQAAVKLVLVGEGPLFPEIQAHIKHYVLEDHVFLPGYIDNASSVLALADVYVNCSTTEGFPITILEAFRAGCPVIASDIEANRFVLDEGRLGDIYHLGDCNELANKLVSYQNKSGKEIAQRAAELKQFFSENYTVKKMSENYASIYEELIST
jgi:glycosyltransferase involved in cell wall biosynthesis